MAAPTEQARHCGLLSTDKQELLGSISAQPDARNSDRNYIYMCNYIIMVSINNEISTKLLPLISESFRSSRTFKKF